LFYRISPAVLQTNWFVASVITELLLIVSIRSMLPIVKAGRPAPIVLLLSAGAVLITLALPIIPATAAFFEFATPTPAHLRLILGLAVLYLATSELVKRPLARFLSNNTAPGTRAQVTSAEETIW
ncbi:MAG: hypothetical protein FJ026_16705, partial [Chloroflexi bacterium]|nr:hypothetical protein [Chloroflexota bacterium]